jgi:hypothetical protein
MAKRINASRIVLDWQRLLGFDQGTGADGATSTAALSPKIGPKEARGFNNYSTAPVSAAKVGQKESGIRQAKVGVKSDVRFGASLPISVTAKIGSKDNPTPA